MEKVYKSKENLLFRIVDVSRPAEGNIAHFTRAEWDWLKSSCISSQEFAFLHRAKIEDHRYQMIPEKEVKQSQVLAEIYATAIIHQLKGHVKLVSPPIEEKDPTVNDRALRETLETTQEVFKGGEVIILK